MKHLDEFKRLTLMNQYLILFDLATLRNDEYMANKYKRYIKILECGYIGQYYMLFSEKLSVEFPKWKSDLVLDILNIYSRIHYSYKKIKSPQIKESEIKFDGFDGNFETEYYAFCNFVLFDLNRFDELKEGGRCDFDSHCPRCEKYRDMQQKWISMGKPNELNEDNILYLIS